MTVRVNWRENAACCNADPDLFFPIGTNGAALRQIQEAKLICRSCPAQLPCLSWALDNRVADGVWGGTTEDERRVIRSHRAPKTTGKEDDHDTSDHPAEQGEHGPRAAAHDAVRAIADHRGDRREDQSADAHSVRTGDGGQGGFSRDFVTADGQRVMVAALTTQQFAELATATRLVKTFAFLERAVQADFSTSGGLHANRAAIAMLLAPWFSRRTVADLAAAFTGTSVRCTCLHHLTGRPRSGSASSPTPA